MGKDPPAKINICPGALNPMVGSPPSISRVSGLRSRSTREETGPDTHVSFLHDHPAGSSSSACQSYTQLLHWVSKPHWILGMVWVSKGLHPTSTTITAPGMIPLQQPLRRLRMDREWRPVTLIFETTPKTETELQSPFLGMWYVRVGVRVGAGLNYQIVQGGPSLMHRLAPQVDNLRSPQLF